MYFLLYTYHIHILLLCLKILDWKTKRTNTNKQVSKRSNKPSKKQRKHKNEYGIKVEVNKLQRQNVACYIRVNYVL